MIRLVTLLLIADLCLMPDGPWEQDEAMMASGVVDFAIARHTPHPPGFPGWIALGRLLRVAVPEPLAALRVASSLAHAGTVALLALLLARLVAPTVAWAAALLYGVLPGVWFHAPRAFSTTPALFFGVLGVWCLLRTQPAMAMLGWGAVGWGVLVRPHLAPVLAVASLVGVWTWRRRPGWLAGGIAAALAVVAAGALVVVHDSGGWERFLRVTREHGASHFGALDLSAVRVAEFGVIRALGGEVPGTLWALASTAGLLVLTRRRLLAALWLFGVAATAAWLLLAVHDPTVPRYAPALILPLAVGVAVVADAVPRWVTFPLLGASAVASVAYTAPAMVALTRSPLPAVAAVRHVADAKQGYGLLYHSQGLLPFVRFQQRTRAVAVEIKDERAVSLHGDRPGMPFAYVCIPGGCRMLPGPTVEEQRFAHWPLVANRLALRRFREGVVYSGGVLLGPGIDPVECSSRGACRARVGARALLFPQPGAATLGLTLGIRAAPPEGGVLVLAHGEGRTSLRLSSGEHVIRLPLGGSGTAVELLLDPALVDGNPTAAHLLAAWCEGERLVPPAFSASPGQPVQARRLGIYLEGFFSPERFGPAGLPGAWTQEQARVVLPAGPGLLHMRLLAPSPIPRQVSLRWEGQQRSLVVGTEPVVVSLPVVGRPGATDVAIVSSTAVPAESDPPSGDRRRLGVVLLDLTFTPSQPADPSGES